MQGILHIYTQPHTHTYIHIYIYVYVYIYLYTYIHIHTHTHTWAPVGKLENLYNEPLGSFITEVPIIVLMEMYIIFLILTQISIYH